MTYEEHLTYCEREGLEPCKEVIICAANLLEDGTIVCGARHWDQIMRSNIKHNCGKVVQGFINQFGEFRTRLQAMEIVKSNGQPFDAKRNGSTTMLFSEGLY